MKILYTILILLLLIIGGALYYYFVMLPEKLSTALIHEGQSEPIPQKIIEKGKSIGLEVKEDPKDIIKKLNEKNTNIDELKDFVRSVEYDQVEKFLKDASKQELDSSELAYQYLRENFDFGDFPIDSFESEFNQYFEPERLNDALDFYERNKNQMPVIYPMLKETFIKYLDKIEKEAKNDSLATP